MCAAAHKTGYFQVTHILSVPRHTFVRPVLAYIPEMTPTHMKNCGKTWFLGRMLQERDQVHHTIRKEISKLQRIVSDHIKVLKHWVQLEKKKQLDSWSKKLKKRETLIETERQKLEETKMKSELRKSVLQLAFDEQKCRKFPALFNKCRKFSGTFGKYRYKCREFNGTFEFAALLKKCRYKCRKLAALLKKCSREKEAALEKVLELGRSSECEKQKLEVTELVGNGVNGDDDASIQQKIDGMSTVRQEAFKKLVAGLYNLPSVSCFSTTNDTKVSKIACGLRFPLGRPQIKDGELCALWAKKIKNPEWNPFVIFVDEIGNSRWLLNKNDELLRGMEYEWGYEVYDAVTTALIVLQNYNPSGSYIVPQLWSFMENRKATEREVIAYIIVQLKTIKHGETWV
ncbi:hypothetical protein OROMI_004233 [Orobanche minor]